MDAIALRGGGGSPYPESADHVEWQRLKRDGPGRCRTNSRRGESDPARHSFPPVESVQRAFEVLRVLNTLKIGSITEIHQATGLPKPTIVRMLETLIASGYVARDNMYGGYRVTCRTRELSAGYNGVSMVIEASRAPAIELTRRVKWPVGIGVLENDSIAIQFWTGPISPFVHTNTVLGLHPTLLKSAMGRAYMAFCPSEEREALLSRLRSDSGEPLTAEERDDYCALLVRVRANGYAIRDQRTEPKAMITVAMPLCLGERVVAAMSMTFYKSAVPPQLIKTQSVDPLLETRRRIEENLYLLAREPHDVSCGDVPFGHA